MKDARRSSTTLAPGFYGPFTWALGIEDTFVPQVHARSGRVLDEYVLTQHDRFWRDDLRMVASTGIRHMRYGIPWYQVNPAPGRFDWSWTDQALPFLVEELGIQPILDLVHYGAPLWLDDTFLAPDYPERIAEYAAAVAERYGRLIKLWTPLNEPSVHAHFAGRVSAWPPYRRGEAGYARVLTSLARGMALTVDAIRAVQEEAVMVWVEAMNTVETQSPQLQHLVNHRLEHQFLALDLTEGRVVPGHPMWQYLLDNRVPPAWLEELAGGQRRVEIYGGNYYSQFSSWTVEGDATKPRMRRRPGKGADLEHALREAHLRTQRPIMLTETSYAGSVRGRRRWLNASVAAVNRIRDDGVPLIGYTWFPAFSLVAWSYRTGKRPTEAYMAHMGLWDLRDDGNGTLRRVPTGLDQEFAQLVAAESRSDADADAEAEDAA
jgi:beta-glucosidase/6-phospho-beta-glucosidase/beta-galactosidase